MPFNFLWSSRLVTFSSALFFTLLSNFAIAELSSTQEESKNKGLILFNQFKSAKSELYIPAEAGDPDAQYFLAEELRQQNRYITAEAQRWYEAAALQGDLYAMLRLATSENDLCNVMNNCTQSLKKRTDWIDLLNKETEKRANDNDGEAMYVKYLFTGQLEWLEKSAEFKFARSQWLLANRYKEGEKFFLPWKRTEEVGRLLKASAENGFPAGMLEYAAYLYEHGGDLSDARYWIEEAAKTGYQSGVSSYGAYLAHASSLYDFPLDLVKGYALTSLLTELDGGGNIKPYVDEVLPEIANKMSPAQITEAKAFAKQWKDTHPPLSFYPGKYGL
ncbi:UNVERIFIED_ORG: TPR repeat protein [Pseudomonas fluorescens]|nr:TPR repeat protein [Pseudomonas fluorescens]